MPNQVLTFDFTPDPKVLIALSHTSMAPMDALCELIDNAIDSFSIAKLRGIDIKQPIVWVDLPSKADISKGIGSLRIRDNGPGMTPEQAEKAIKAGYSGNNSFDSLGLFGMGFNISTSKFGRLTTFLTCRPEDTFFTKAVIDLEKINQTKSYALEAETIEKSPNFEQGTIIEVSGWWPAGNPNSDFIKKLIQYGDKKIMQEIGRRYATILKDKKIRILVNRNQCEPFEHCVWGSNRFVERNGKQIPARYDFDTVICTKRRCGNCRTIIPDGDNECPSCHSTLIRSVEERIKGWVGIQRFDDPTQYGIDLIRNGRAIRPAEKSAFFEFVDEFKNVIKDYPIDGPYGRIVGEVHLDFVPVDFLKQDFQRSSEEWREAMKFLRGESSLQPRQPGADQNTSVVFKLYQGYRKVRECGRADMYMGYWDPTEGKAKRISRDVEKEFYQRFLKKEPGYYDDEKWWEKVEEASNPPIQPLAECPNCHCQNLVDDEVCQACGEVLIGKTCINPDCNKIIPKSAVICQFCGTSQIVSVKTPWTCDVCKTANKADDDVCKVCGKPRGTKDPLSEEYLVTISNKDDFLSVDGLTVTLADGKESAKINVTTYISSLPLLTPIKQKRLPLVIFKTVNSIHLFIDPTHPSITNSKVPMEEMVAMEIASFIYSINMSMAKYPEHSLSTITWEIIDKLWADEVGISHTKIKEACAQFLSKIKSLVADHVDPSEVDIVFSEMDKHHTDQMLATMYENGLDVNMLPALKQSGQILKYIPNDMILVLYDNNPKAFFNGNVWDEKYGSSTSEGLSEMLKYAEEPILKNYRNSIETLVLFDLYPQKDGKTLRRVDAALQFLKLKLGE